MTTPERERLDRQVLSSVTVASWAITVLGFWTWGTHGDLLVLFFSVLSLYVSVVLMVLWIWLDFWVWGREP